MFTILDPVKLKIMYLVSFDVIAKLKNKRRLLFVTQLRVWYPFQFLEILCFLKNLENPWFFIEGNVEWLFNYEL